MKYCKYIFLGGQLKRSAEGSPVQLAPVNFEKGGVKLLLIAVALMLIAPLLFVQSSVGIIPYENPKGFTDLSAFYQYLHSLTFNLISVLKSFLTKDGFPPDMPKPQGLVWQFLVSISVLFLNGVAAFTLVSGAKKIFENYQAYKRSLS